MSNNDIGDHMVSTNEVSSREIIEYEKLEELLLNMSKDSNQLKQGYTIMSIYEKCRNFYLNFLKIIFANEKDIKVKKLAASTLKIFLTKNWSDDDYITNEERMV
jgi:hypothetical protein